MHLGPGYQQVRLRLSTAWTELRQDLLVRD